ncbi:hypothetical protein OG937_21300 [Streptomyces sp. NBC_00510]
MDDGKHRGDLRYFLLVPPADAEVYGDEEGTDLSRSEVADSADVKQALATYGFKAAAQRTYLTGDGEYEVSAQLVRFASAGSATGYYNAFYYQGTRITLPSSGSPAKAYRLSSSSAESTGSVIVLSHQGDVHLTLSVTGAKTPGQGPARPAPRPAVPAPEDRPLSRTPKSPAGPRAGRAHPRTPQWRTLCPRTPPSRNRTPLFRTGPPSARRADAAGPPC